jgi:hypothetical protein
MEFERAIFRVYERCMEGLREERDAEGNTSTKSCKFLEILAFFSGVFLLFILIFLHIAFVGSPGCLPELLDLASSGVNGTNTSSGLHYDQLLYITVDKKFQPQNNLRVDQSDASLLQPKYIDVSRYSTKLRSAYNGYNWKTSESVAQQHVEFRGSSTRINSYLWSGADNTESSIESLLSDFKNDSTVVPVEGSSTGDSKEPAYDYKFTFNSGLLLLPYDQLIKHNYKMLNVTMSGVQCFGSQFTQSMIPVGSVDTVVVNALMYTLGETGYVVTGTGDYFRWSYSDLHPYSTPAEWLVFKVSILFYSLFAFFFLTTITALLIRILISSGVVLIFPVFWAMQLCGFPPISLRIVAISYPWIGLPLEIIRSRNQSIVPFIIGHISRVAVYYYLYQATQLVFSIWFYNRDSPGQQELWIFGLMMIWEYYSMIYVRSMESIQLFPRASLALFLIYHFYYFSFPSGFHVLALLTLLCFLGYLMTYCIREFEMKAFERGIVNLDQPR